MSLVEITQKGSPSRHQRRFSRRDPFESISSYRRSCYFYKVSMDQTGRALDFVRLRTCKRNGHRVFLFHAIWSGKSGENTDNQDTSVIKRTTGKKKALHLSGSSECGEIVWDVYVKEMTYMSTISRPTRERDGWVERKRKKAKSLWKMKCDSLSLGKVNLDHEFPLCWETFSGFTPPLQSTISPLITQPESNLASLVFSKA